MLRLVFLPFLFALPIQIIEPVSLEILFDGVPAVGGGWVLTVTLLAHTDLEQVKLEIIASEGLRIDAGKPFWEGSLDVESEAIIELAYTVIGPLPQEVLIELKGRTSEGRPFQKSARRTIRSN